MTPDPELQAQIEALTKRMKDRALLYQELIGLISDYRMKLDQKAFDEQIAALGHYFIADRFFSWLSKKPEPPVITVTMDGKDLIIDFNGGDQ